MLNVLEMMEMTMWRHVQKFIQTASAKKTSGSSGTFRKLKLIFQGKMPKMDLKVFKEKHLFFCKWVFFSKKKTVFFLKKSSSACSVWLWRPPTPGWCLPFQRATPPQSRLPGCGNVDESPSGLVWARRGLEQQLLRVSWVFSRVFLGFSRVFLGFSKVYPGFAFLVIFKGF